MASPLVSKKGLTGTQDERFCGQFHQKQQVRDTQAAMTWFASRSDTASTKSLDSQATIQTRFPCHPNCATVRAARMNSAPFLVASSYSAHALSLAWHLTEPKRGDCGFIWGCAGPCKRPAGSTSYSGKIHLALDQNMAVTRRIIRLPELSSLIGRSRSSVYDILNPRTPRHISDFPRPVRLGNTPRSAIGWHLDEVLTWLDSRQRTPTNQPCR